MNFKIPQPTEEMFDHFYKRTAYHISLVDGNLKYI